MKFIVSVREVYVQMIEVEADSVKDATQRVERGEGSILDDTLEFSHRLSTETWTVEKQNG